MPNQEDGTDPLPDAGYEAREAVSQWLDVKWTEPGNCPICGTDGWSIGDVALIPVRRPGAVPGQTGINESQSAYPLAPVSCGNCGYTILFNEKRIRDEGRAG